MEQTFLSAHIQQSETSESRVWARKTRRRRWKKDGAIYWITFSLADAIPRDKRRAFQEARKLWLKRHNEYWHYKKGYANFSSACVAADGQ